MNPFYESGIPVVGLGVCGSCGGVGCSECSPCHKNSCGYPEPIFGIDRVQDTPAAYRLNINGKTVTWDLQPGIYDGQTDTTLVIDLVNRLLQFSAERHRDSISASELGSILHLNDLGDVSTKGVEDGSMMVYRKSDNCGNGCFGTNNVWEPWNALDEQTSSAAYAAGYNATGNPVSIQQPPNADQYYNLCWNKGGQLSYAQVTEASELRLDAEGYAYQQYIDPTTKEPYYIKVKP